MKEKEKFLKDLKASQGEPSPTTQKQYEQFMKMNGLISVVKVRVSDLLKGKNNPFR